jgi:hypothetical protein
MKKHVNGQFAAAGLPPAHYNKTPAPPGLVREN